MIQALLATFSFALSTVCGHRAARLIGGIETNFWRLVIATLLLAGWAYGFGEGLSGDAFPVFIISGFVGIGIGDVALYSALPMLGSRLTVLLLQCLTTIFAIVMEWLWLGTRLTAGELACGAVILGGVAIALRPREYLHLRGKLAAGLTLTIVAAFGNALGLLGQFGMDFGHVASATAYLKRAGDFGEFLRAASAHGLPAAVPTAVVVADICRPEWLCEIELCAAKAT